MKKRVQCFLHKNTYYELQTFVQPNIGLSILKTELDKNVEEVTEFPWFVQVKGEITGIPEFSSFFLAEHYNNVDSRLLLNWKSNQVRNTFPHSIPDLCAGPSCRIRTRQRRQEIRNVEDPPHTVGYSFRKRLILLGA